MTENQIVKVNVEPMKITLNTLIRVNAPADPYEAALYYGAMAGLLHNLSNDFRVESESRISAIREVNPSSDRWELVGTPRNESAVLYDRLRDEQPDLWFDCLTISATNAVRLLGGDDAIKKLIIKKRGRDDFVINSSLTLGTARKKLTKAKQAEYIKTETHITDYQIVPKTPAIKEATK